MSNNIFRIITEEIIDRLNHGHVPWKNPWAYEYPHQNFFTARPYTGINAFILNSKAEINEWTYPFWGTMGQFNSLGGRVRRGSKATRVIYYKQKKNHFVAFYHTVYNIEQIDGLEFQPIKKENQPIPDIEGFLNEFYKEMPKVEFIEGINPRYAIAQDIIKIPPKDSFTNIHEYYSTLFHEIAHSTGKSYRMGRLEKSGKGDFSGTKLKIRDDLTVNPMEIKEEIICEMVSCLLCSFFGIFPQTKVNQKAYIRTWLGYLKNNSNLIIQAGQSSEKIFKYIKDNIKGFKFREQTFVDARYTQNLNVFTANDFLTIENDKELNEHRILLETLKKSG